MSAGAIVATEHGSYAITLASKDALRDHNNARDAFREARAALEEQKASHSPARKRGRPGTKCRGAGLKSLANLSGALGDNPEAFLRLFSVGRAVEEASQPSSCPV